MHPKANDIVKSHMYWAIGAGGVPVPILDIVAVTGIQLDMLKQLSACYEIPFSEEQGKAWLSAMSASVLARLGANAVKLIPGIGSIIGGVSMAVMSGASTYALGRVAVEHFEARGTFDDLDLDKARTRYEAAFEEGKEVARKAKAAKDAASESVGGEDRIAQLERLAALHSQGALTDEEFKMAKAKLLS